MTGTALAGKGSRMFKPVLICLHKHCLCCQSANFYKKSVNEQIIMFSFFRISTEDPRKIKKNGPTLMCAIIRKIRRLRVLPQSWNPMKKTGNVTTPFPRFFFSRPRCFKATPRKGEKEKNENTKIPAYITPFAEGCFLHEI